MSLLRYFTSCMSRSKNVVNNDNCKTNHETEDLDVFYVTEIPNSIKELLVYIAREGVAVTDLFRRPGNTQHIKRVMRQLKQGEDVDWSKYNFYTLANIAKRYLLQIDRGILGEEVECQLVNSLNLSDDQARIEEMSRVLKSLSPDVLQLLALLFGTWFRMIYHSEVNAMSVEAVAKSVAGSIFPSCTVDPNQVNKASKVMEYLITGFASSELFGIDLIEYFADQTKTSISRTEKFKYEFIYPKNVSKKKSARLFVRMLLEESTKHGFDLLKDEVTEEQFNAVDNCAVVSDNAIEDSSSILVPCNPEGDNKTRKRRLSKTISCPPQPMCFSTSHSDQVQQTSEKRTCVIASSTDIGLTTTKSTHEFDMTQECIHHKTGNGVNIDTTGSQTFTSESSSPPMDSCKNPRLDISENLKMDEIMKSEMKKMETRLRSEESSKAQNGCATGGRFGRVKRQQLERLQKRSDWFLSPPSGCKSEALMQLSPTSPILRDAPLSIASDCGTMSGTFDLDELSHNKIDESYSNSVRNSEIGGNLKSNVSNLVCLSDPTLFHSSVDASVVNDTKTRDCPPKDTANHNNEEDSSQEEVEVRYFVVRKHYGPLRVKTDQVEE